MNKQRIIDECNRLVDSGQNRECIELLTEAIANNPEESQYYGYRGSILSSAGKHLEALDDFRNSVQIDPHYELGYISQCNEYRFLGLDVEALESIKKAYELNSNDPLIARILAQCLIRDGQYLQSRDVLERAIVVAPKDADLWSGLAHTYEKLELFSESVEAQKRACEFEPDDAFEFVMLVHRFIKLNDFTSARDALRIATEKLQVPEAEQLSAPGEELFELCKRQIENAPSCQ